MREYFLFDPEGSYQKTPLLGFRLEGDELKPMVPEQDGSLISRELGVLLRVEGMLLRVVSLSTGEPYSTFLETDERIQAAWQQAEQHRQAYEQAQRQAEHERKAHEQERQAREQAQQQAEQERQAREEAERRAAELSDELARLRGEQSR